MRSGPPKDKDSDYDNGIWAGVINLNTLVESVALPAARSQCFNAAAHRIIY